MSSLSCFGHVVDSFSLFYMIQKTQKAKNLSKMFLHFAILVFFSFLSLSLFDIFFVHAHTHDNTKHSKYKIHKQVDGVPMVHSDVCVRTYARTNDVPCLH